MHVIKFFKNYRRLYIGNKIFQNPQAGYFSMKLFISYAVSYRYLNDIQHTCIHTYICMCVHTLFSYVIHSMFSILLSLLNNISCRTFHSNASFSIPRIFYHLQKSLWAHLQSISTPNTIVLGNFWSVLGLYKFAFSGI